MISICDFLITTIHHTYDMNIFTGQCACELSLGMCRIDFYVGSVFEKKTRIWFGMGLVQFASEATTCGMIEICISLSLLLLLTRGQSNLTKSASPGAHSPVRGHPRGSKVVPLNSWGRVSY